MNPKLKEKILESLSAVLPITFIVLAVSVFLVPMDTGTVVMFFVGALMLIVGMGMFQLGAEMAMSPLGEGVGVEIAKRKRAIVILPVSFLMGALITLAEPDLQVLSNQVPSIPNSTLIVTVAVGVGIFLALAVVRIVLKVSLSVLLTGLYACLLALSFFVPKDFLPVAFDSGGVTTGPITVPFIMAMGVGLSSVRGDKNASSDSFGLVALSSVGPVLAVLLLGCFFNPQEAAYAAGDLVVVDTMRDVAQAFAFELPRYAKEVFLSIVPILGMCLAFHLITHRYQHRQKLRIAVGFGYTALGLVLFLCGVNVGFAPVGTQLGSQLAAGHGKWLLVPIGVLIGYFIVKAEPAIQILNHQVQSVTNGTVSASSMNRCLSVGVSVSVGLSMLRVLTGLPIHYIIIPGYGLALALSWFVPKIFVGIAFDSGGVASGPMTSTFLLPLCLGACQTLGGNVMTDAFGAIALVALTPLIAVQIMGLQYKRKLSRLQKEAQSAMIMPEETDDIVEIEME
ncbi:DUF1538 domain-containing protein [Acutalibacter sp. 1XD8-33]|uniref:DUF1538 domain-containing protein n=1 Tax=Acutalibacter sp. 1XD8-33 TaxID=2320081 RepID=UPI000EA30BD9|nr:DUF1538 domain-containing protein [Acutalibacter sp. 1XD8-33]RKJ40709.1 DUF1538 domain-containing protein [Acutalibacter sp. 1XD8-33]